MSEPDVLISLCLTGAQNAFGSQSSKPPLLGGRVDGEREDGNQGESFKHLLLTWSC